MTSCHLVDLAGVPCATEPSLAGGVDPTGYAVPNWAYTEAQFADIVAVSGDLFEAHGFARPTSYRAGGWTATTDTLRALASEGILVDSSANNWARMDPRVPDPWRHHADVVVAASVAHRSVLFSWLLALHAMALMAPPVGTISPKRRGMNERNSVFMEPD